MAKVIFWILLLFGGLRIISGFFGGDPGTGILGLILVAIAIAINWSGAMKGLSKSNQFTQDKANYRIDQCSRAFEWRVCSNKPARGGARLSGKQATSCTRMIRFRWVSIFLITAGSSILAIILTAPAHSLPVSWVRNIYKM